MAEPDRDPNRDVMAKRLHEDLVGPRESDETLDARPSDVYLTGILWPRRGENTGAYDASGEADEKLGFSGGSASDDGASAEADAVPATSVQKPSVAGLSFCVASEDKAELVVSVSFGYYELGKHEDTGKTKWTRKQFQLNSKIISLPLSDGPYLPLAEGRDLPLPVASIRLFIRMVNLDHRSLVTVSLVNETIPEAGRDAMEESSLFQVAITVKPGRGTSLIPKPDRRAVRADDVDEESFSDEQSSRLLYRKVNEFAVGHVCAADWGTITTDATGTQETEWVRTTWIPSSIVPIVDPNGHPFFHGLEAQCDGFDPLSAVALAHAEPNELSSGLDAFCNAYTSWLQGQQSRLDDKDDVPDALQAIASTNLKNCNNALERMREAASILGEVENAKIRRAFQLANFAMHVQYAWDPEKSQRGPLRWRPFQLGFLLLSCLSSADRGHAARGIMDLLWFPTGGGKTEAYLALIAMVSVYRRLSDDPADHEGVASLMRYTLRLLTTQQFARSAAVMLALEAIRTRKVNAPEGLPLRGDEPFSIGLWVGGEATPNKRSDAWEPTIDRSYVGASPQQLARCPACQQELSWTMQDKESPVVAACQNEQCELYGPLPVWTVDDDVYEKRPTLLIGTIDKFAQIVRNANTNRLFSVGNGSPPDLIIQDELHLISGPLGTIAGTYETAFDLMFTRNGIPPKVIGSTATIRRAAEQVRDLFDRRAFQFPPPALDYDDSGFAVPDQREDATGRRYLGVTTAGRSAKFTLQAVAASLLQSARAAFHTPEEQDAYWTLLGYFNSIRELGGALVLMQDDVTDSIELYSEAREEQARPMMSVEELTSRRTQAEILNMLSVLGISAGESGAVDAVLATNMVSVGVDISRLGLMMVNGQPKTIAEYIQSTSRVGRGRISGLIVSVLNNAKARDRSHFETFESWHRTLYRDVEATSVTPFASRARDRALHAALVGAVRHLVPQMLDDPSAIDQFDDEVFEVMDQIADRAERIDPEEDKVLKELEELVQSWRARSPEIYWNDRKGQKSLLQSAEQAASRRAAGRTPGAAWPTMNSMRSVEAGTPFRMANFLATGSDGDE